MDWGAKWDKPPAWITGLVKRAAVPGLHVAGKAMVAETKRAVGIEGYGTPSSPGMPPHKQTGELQASFEYRVDKRSRIVHVYSNHPAAFYLEFGTRDMAARPFMLRSLLRYAEKHGASHFRAHAAARHSPIFFQDVL